MDGTDSNLKDTVGADSKIGVVEYVDAGYRRMVVLASDFSPPYTTGRVEHVGSFVLRREPEDHALVAQLKLSQTQHVLVHATRGRWSNKNPAPFWSEVASDITTHRLALDAYLFAFAWQLEALQGAMRELKKWGRDPHRTAYEIIDTRRTNNKDGKIYTGMSFEPRPVFGEVLDVATADALRAYGNARSAATTPYPLRTAREVFELLDGKQPSYGLHQTETARAPAAAGPANLSASEDDIVF